MAPAYESALSAVSSRIAHLYCVWHMLTAVKVRLQAILQVAPASNMSSLQLRAKVMELFKKLVYNPESEEEYAAIANSLKATVAEHATAASADQFRIYFGRYHLKRTLWSYVARMNAEHYGQRTSNIGETGHRHFKDTLQSKSTCHSAIKTFVSHCKQQAQRFIDVLNYDNRHLPSDGDFMVGRMHANRAACELIANELKALTAYQFAVELKDAVINGLYHQEVFTVRYQRERMVLLVYPLSAMPATGATPMHQFLCTCQKPIQLRLPCRHVLAVLRHLFDTPLTPGLLSAEVIRRWHTSFTGRYAVRLFRAMRFSGQELVTFQYLPPGAPDIVLDDDPAAPIAPGEAAADVPMAPPAMPSALTTLRAPKRGRDRSDGKVEEKAAKTARATAVRPASPPPPASPPRAEQVQLASPVTDGVGAADAGQDWYSGNCDTAMEDPVYGHTDDDEPPQTQDALDPPSERATLNKLFAAVRTMFFKLPTGVAREVFAAAMSTHAASEFVELGGKTFDYPREPGMSQSKRVRSRGEWN